MESILWMYTEREESATYSGFTMRVKMVESWSNRGKELEIICLSGTNAMAYRAYVVLHPNTEEGV